MIKLLFSALISTLAAIGAHPVLAVEPVPPFSLTDQRDHVLAGKIYLPAEEQLVDPEDMLRHMRGAEFVLLGEKHGHPDHHAFQAWIVRRLLSDNRRTAVAFEMFGTDQTRQIARHLSRRPKDAAGLGKATGWEKTGWPDWSLYSPIAQAALDAGLPIVAANLPESEAKAMTRKQPLSPDRLTELGLDEPMSRQQYTALEADIRIGHCNLLPDSAVSPMVMAQRAKDGSMAAMLYRASRAQGTDGAVLITGAGHARRDRGVPLALARLAPGARIFALAFVEVVPGETDPAAYAAAYGDFELPFDAVWFTPRLEGEDPCAEFAKHMRKHGKGAE